MNLFRYPYMSVFILFYKINSGQRPSKFQFDLYKGIIGVSTFIGLMVAIFINNMNILNLYAPYKWVGGGSFLIIYLANGYYLAILGKGLQFEKEFQQFSKTKKNMLYFMAISIVIVIGATFYMSALAHRRMLGFK